MKKLLVRSVTFIAFFTALFFSGAQIAIAQSEVDNFIQTKVAQLNSGQSDIAAYSNSPVGYVIIPPGVIDPNGGPQINDITPAIANAITSYEAIVFEHNNSLSARVKNNELDPAEITEIIRNSSDPNAAVAALKDYVNNASSSTSTDTPTEENSGVSSIFNVILIIAGVIVLIIVVVIIIARKRKSESTLSAVSSKVVSSNKLRDSLDNLSSLYEDHQRFSYPTAPIIKSIHVHLNELFSRLKRKGVESQINMAELEYGNTLAKLEDALGQDYYLDIARNSTLWDEPQRRLQEVEAAAKAVDVQIVANIRQVNSSKDLDFRVALESILRSVDRPSATAIVNGKKK